MDVVLPILIVLIVLAILAGSSLRLVQQYQRGVVLRFGRLREAVREPGLHVLVPFVDRMTRVSVQTVVLDIPKQGAITRDNVTVDVDAVVYFRVDDPVKAVINIQDYVQATSTVAQTSLRSVIGRAELDTLLSDRDQINTELRDVIDAPTENWGITIDRVEVKDIALPESMRRSMSAQAEAERERRARIISADGEFQASSKLSEAAGTMADTPGAMQLRLLQTVADVAAEKNSTLVMPFPVELLRFFEHATATQPRTEAPVVVGTDADPSVASPEPEAPSARPLSAPVPALALPEPVSPVANGVGPDRP